LLLGAPPLAFGSALVLFQYRNVSPLAYDFRGAGAVTVRRSA
jgi:hypothetical protein